MVTKVEDGYRCDICNTIHPRDVYALSCEQSHDVVYVPFKFADLKNLVEFLYTRNEQLLTPSLVNTILNYKSYMKGRNDNL
jgi:hypothetical protein